MISFMTSSSSSLSERIKNDRQSLLNNPLSLMTLLHDEFKTISDKGKQIEKLFHQKLLDPKTSVFGDVSHMIQSANTHDTNSNTDESSSKIINPNEIDIAANDNDQNSSSSTGSKSPLTMIQHFVEACSGKASAEFFSSENISSIKDMTQKLLNSLDQLKDHLKDGDSMIPSGCLFSLVACCVAALLREVENNAKKEWNAFYQDAKQTIHEFYTQLTGSVLEAFSKLKDLTVSTFKEIQQTILKTMECAKGFTKEVVHETEQISERHLLGLLNMGNILKGLKEKNFLTSQFEQLHEEFKQVLKHFSTSFITGMIQNMLEPVVKFAQSVGEIVKELLSSSLSAMIQLFEKFIELVKSTPDRVKNIFDFSHQHCVAALCLSKPQEMIDAAVDTAGKLLSSVPLESIVNALKTLKESVEKQFSTGNVVSEWADQLKEVASEISNAIHEQDSLLSKLDANLDDIKQIVSEIEEKGMNTVLDKAEHVIDKVTDALHVPSPVPLIKKFF
ncbi:hypothetical protein C9374_002523 [Naegleria lovaniensis]|uniref:Uncharacterized protein n=1 Tax=Naegleria lovaniensis TaxID=51637 RepID=A0AA88GW24_NAELO|nr:uncharacterized protein C9374_002523 [Naegleria lovaniensis]KAG2386779.1 hypothetical protein C9374_002523 [Naegleria lovaniensis]